VAEFDIMYNEGISKSGDVLDLGVEMGLIEKRGSFFICGETRIGQGRENAKEYLKSHPELAGELEAGIRQQGLARSSDIVAEDLAMTVEAEA
jgi:recombination protein RecA